MKKYFIYKYTFPNGKVYVGQSCEGSHRYGNKSSYKTQVVYRAMCKYPDYQKEILSYCCEYLVDYLESYYISKYDSMNPENGYNMESGGNENKHISEDTKKKISEFQKGKTLSDDTKKKISKSLSINVYCVELDKEFYGIREAARELGLSGSAISKCCRGKYKSTGGYHFRYKEVS